MAAATQVGMPREGEAEEGTGMRRCSSRGQILKVCIDHGWESVLSSKSSGKLLKSF